MFLTRKQRTFRFFHKLVFTIAAMLMASASYAIYILIFFATN